MVARFSARRRTGPLQTRIEKVMQKNWSMWECSCGAQGKHDVGKNRTRQVRFHIQKYGCPPELVKRWRIPRTT